MNSDAPMADPGRGSRPATRPAPTAITTPATRAPGNPRVGYYFAVLNAIISGVAIYVNSIGVKAFSDSTLSPRSRMPWSASPC